MPDDPSDDVAHDPGGPGTAGEHYFTARPASADERRTLSVRLAGRDVTVETAGGVFSPGRLDLGTEVLLRSVPQPPSTGDLLDLGCGWGPVALTLALESPDARVWAVDVNERALDLVRRNADRLGLTGVRAVTPDAVPDDVALAALWSNPPIRVGKQALHAMLVAWLPRLAPGAQAHLVVQRNLGADSLQRWLAEALVGAGPATDLTDEVGSAAGPGPGERLGELTVERAASAKGFRVLRVSRA
ncbi:class I SAM-dependent methyltransferase [uncultured Cellulomonas sp.]|uniref:class I SAM-dependent methyltransferase n=1 Tax=uncultured Cellulomonas sp. TaxID=189682 RepID=UPI00262DFE2C|nr:methyltransferase [uncultured Cellulomonas sp.]